MTQPYRPPQWATGIRGQSYFVIEPYPTGNVTIYTFDASLRVEHHQQLAITRHPVQVSTQTGAPGGSISDHAYLQPASVTFEIGMSDAMDRFQSGDYSGGSSKSVNAYQAFLAVQARRLPLVVATRLNVYNNMLISDLRPVEDKGTRFALRAMLVFEQIIMGLVSVAAVSAEPQITDTTPGGTKQPEPVTPAQTEQYNTSSDEYETALSQATAIPPQPIPGAGTWGSLPWTQYNWPNMLAP
jgi:hypothetical protein